jgi:A-macroglobulin complement component/alpha-2-macroglobulin family protein/carboxypeptidase family protein/MG2 domain-containing protein/macroglobulin-like protein/A-macroglobulin receptor
MSQRRLLSLFCLSLLFLLVIQLTRAGGDLRVDESRTRFMLYRDREEVLLAIENTTGETRNVTVKLELLDTRDSVLAETTGTQSVAPGSQKLRLSLPPIAANLSEFNRRYLLWYRLRYRMVDVVGSGMSINNGIISLSEIMPDLFEIHVATSQMLREGGRYSARVQTTNPFTHQPARGVRITGEITFEDDETVKPKASAITDKEGYALLDFALPLKSAKNSTGELHVYGERDGVVAQAQGEVLVDNVVRTLITTDKVLYQPGQTMHIRALVFGPTKRARADENFTIRIVDPEQVSVFVTTARSSRFGVINADWPIPDNVRLGDYRIWVDREGATYETAFDVRISRYELPNFSVSVEPDRGYYLPGQDATVKVRADYLFGQPVKRGHVRVVEESSREWNFREQKWDIDEGDEFEGETDPDGVFTANVDLEEAHDGIKDSQYSQFKDVSYSAYFTDPTTNRTEQRRFNLRVTKAAIHVYVIRTDSDSHNPNLPLQFYVSTFYADGAPARCKLDVTFEGDQRKERKEKAPNLKRTLRTNRYGFAKTSLHMPGDFDAETSLNLKVVANDSTGRSGSAKERFWIDDQTRVLVDTEKSLYSAGEPLTATITSNLPDQPLIVDLATDSSVIRSQRVRLRDGHATASFSYAPYLTGRITIAAYPDFADEGRLIATRTVLYPASSELNVNARTSQASYRPGEDASVRLNVRSADGRAAQSALGLVVSDKAVDERMRTDAEFSGRYQPYNSTLANFLGLDEELSGVTFRDLQRLDMTKVISPDLDLLAEVLLNRYRNHYPVFYRSDEYETDLPRVFGGIINAELRPIQDALNARYLRTLQHPSDEKMLRQFLQEARIDLSKFYDPWGVNYRVVFSIEGRLDVLTLMSAGADKRFDTGDDFSVVRLNWEYFKPLGQQIQKAVDTYHQRTNGFIRDRETLREELARAGVSLELIRDRWGQPYRYDFDVEQTVYVIKVNSGGPNRTFSANPDEPTDDFAIWTAQIDYFANLRTKIEQALNEKLKSASTFPQSDNELREALRDTGQPFETLRDPWNRPYYAAFKTESVYGDRLKIENRAVFGNAATQQTEIVPVTRIIATVRIMSKGADGQEGTQDDFAVGGFSRVVAEQPRGKQQAVVVAPSVVLTSSSGAIYGVVMDPMGAVIPGATIEAMRTPDITSYRTMSDDNGEYALKGLPPGLYEVRFEKTGFAAAVVTNVLVQVANYTKLEVTLEPGEVNESVMVTDSGSSALNVTSATVSYSLRQSRVQVITKSGSNSADISTPRLREYFPETLVWQPSIETDGRGRAEVKFKLADNITTWKMAVIGTTEDGRIGIAEKEFKAFQPFFVEHDPPRVLTEGDEIALPVVVRNYLDRLQKVDLEIKPENWFSLLGPGRKQSTVEAGDAARQTFDFRAVKSVDEGRQRITARGADANDAIEKPVTVHPDGEELSVTNGDLLTHSATVELNLPDNAIPGSTRAELKIYPNLMAHVIESVEAIMSRPYGCGEQTISSTYPSLLLLRNYKQNGDDFPERAKAERYLKLGYTRLLNYRDQSGGFAYWGNGNPDIALTAYALRFLTEADGVIELDHRVIEDARQWLIKQQGTDGSWPPHQFGIVGAEQERRVAVLTAYVARTLVATQSKLFAGTADRFAEQERVALTESLVRALDYVDKRSKQIDEPYLLASYALALIDSGDPARAKPLIEKLRSLARREGTGAYWSLETNTPFYGWGIAGRVETTALVVQALSRYCSPANCDDELVKRGLLFLFRQKDRYGVWYSTQATINVLDTMLTLFATSRTSAGESTAQIEINGRAVQTVKLPQPRSTVSPITIPITAFLSAGTNRIEIKRPESGAFSSVQALATYYAPWSDRVENTSSDVRLSTKFDVTKSKIGDTITCHVKAERVGFRGYGMLLAEIGLPPGADVDRSSLETALKDWTIMQYDVLPDRIVFYLWPRAGGVEFDIRFRPRFGLAAKTAPSVIYDYYNPESRMVVPPVEFRVK